MLNQTFTVLFESLFINELGQAGEGKVWFKTKPIEEWIAENTPPISEQPISFMDFDPGTTVFPVVITGIVVLPNGQVTVVTPNGTFLADTTLIPRPVLKPTVLEDKNGNQFIVHPDGTVTNLGQAGFIPKPMTTEEKLDKIRRGLYLEALKDYKTQIETYYTSKNEPIPTRGPRNHNKNIIIDLPECIGTETNEIKDNFLAIKDNVNKKELREKSLKRILEIVAKKGILDGIAQTALNNLTARVKITETEFRQFLSTLQFIAEMEAICGEWTKYLKVAIILDPGNEFVQNQNALLDEKFEIKQAKTGKDVIDIILSYKGKPLQKLIILGHGSPMGLASVNGDNSGLYTPAGLEFCIKDYLEKKGHTRPRTQQGPAFDIYQDKVNRYTQIAKNNGAKYVADLAIAIKTLEFRNTLVDVMDPIGIVMPGCNLGLTQAAQNIFAQSSDDEEFCYSRYKGGFAGELAKLSGRLIIASSPLTSGIQSGYTQPYPVLQSNTPFRQAGNNCWHKFFSDVNIQPLDAPPLLSPDNSILNIITGKLKP